MSRKSYAQSQIPDGKSDTPYLDTTKLVQGLLLRAAECRSGSVVGTGAALDVALDFDPAVVILVDETQNAMAVKFPGQGTDLATVIKAAVAGSVAASITLGALGEKKFTIGTNADLNTAADVIRWIAIGFSATGGQ